MHPNANCNCRYADIGCDKMEEVMDKISGKWKMRILFMVGAHGTLRYGELRRLLDGVTHKMLTNQQKELAADGLVQRIDYAEVPPRVEYRLTADGQALMPILTIYRHISKPVPAAAAAPRPSPARLAARTRRQADRGARNGFPPWGKLSPQVTDEGESAGHFPLIRRLPIIRYFTTSYLVICAAAWYTYPISYNEGKGAQTWHPSSIPRNCARSMRWARNASSR